MKIKTKRTETIINNFIDEMGQIVDTSVEVKTQKIVVDTKEQFAYQYASVIGAISDLNGLDVKVLTYCTLNAGYNTNVIPLMQTHIDSIATTFSVAQGSIRNSVKRLVEKKILFKLQNALYRVNPKYYWRGEGTERSKTLKYILELECPDC